MFNVHNYDTLDPQGIMSYEEGEVIADAEQTIFECPRWQSYRFILTSIIGKIRAGITITSRENWALVSNYKERILRLKKRELEAAEHVDAAT